MDMKGRIAMALAVIVFSLAVGSTRASAQTQHPSSNPTVLRMMQGPFPTDPVDAAAFVMVLDRLNAPMEANALRAYMRTRDIDTLLGYDMPTVNAREASRGPWSTTNALEDARRRFITEAITIDATPTDLSAGEGMVAWKGPTPEHEIAPGVWGSPTPSNPAHYYQFWMAARVTNHLAIPLGGTVRLNAGANDLDCSPGALPPKATAVVLCHSIYVSESEPELKALLAFKAGDDLSHAFRGTIEGGAPVRHAALEGPWDRPLPYEAADAVQVKALQMLDRVPCEDMHACKPTAVDWAKSPAGTAFLFLFGIMVVAVVLRIRSLGSGRAKGWPTGIFVGYLGLVGLTIFICVADPTGQASTQNPYGGLFSVLAKLFTGLPLSLSMLQPGPPNAAWRSDDSPLPVIAILINLVFLAIMTFVEDTPERRKPSFR